MSKKWRLTDRTRTLLTLELAIVLPAAALMAFSVWNLRHIQRDQAIEAAIQRDFSYVLKIAEKKTWEKANAVVVPVSEEFPNPDDGTPLIEDKLDHILRENPGLAYAILYDKKNNLLVARMQPGRTNDDGFCARTGELINGVKSWLPMEATEMAGTVRMYGEKDEPPVAYFGGW